MTDTFEVEKIAQDVWIAGYSEGGHQLNLYSVMDGGEELHECGSLDDARDWAKDYITNSEEDEH